VEQADTNGNGKIEYSEFETLIKGINEHQEEDLRETFEKFDANGDGFVTGMSKMRFGSVVLAFFCFFVGCVF
jgi:Ca2+-binding EF-hand superfamily protein